VLVVAAMSQPETIGTPVQQLMNSGPSDLPMAKLFIKQEMAAIELCGIEAKQRYRVSVANGDKEGNPIQFFITEKSDCIQRICCGPNRALTLEVHEGGNKDGPVMMTMEKPFSCTGCCFLRPAFKVFKSGTPIGEIDDPCRFCTMDQQVRDANNNHIMTMTGSVCQCGVCCPCCAPVTFDIQEAAGGGDLGKVEKLPMDCEELCLKTNRFTVDLSKIQEEDHRRLALASTMLLDLGYFEQSK